MVIEGARIARAMGGPLALLRPANGAVAAVAVAAGAVVAHGAPLEALPSAIGPQVLLGAAAAFSFIGAGNALNDYLDREIDRKGHPDRPIPSGRVRPATARGVSAGLFAVSLLCGALISLTALAAVAALAGLMLAYEWRLKAQGLAGNIAIGVLSGATFAFGGVAVGNLQPTLSLAALGTVASIGREVAKDIEDMEADEGRRTLPQRVGAAKAGAVSKAATVAAVCLSPLPYFLADLGVLYLAAIAAADATFIYAAWVLRASPRRSQSLSKVGMALATAAFALGGLFG
jgi:geranylgeranylglycerol-phosphate geranylgeranyltransferase